MKGIILAGGHGSRLYPLTRVVCKQLLPVYDKPMIYYPLSTLMLAGITDILIISTPSDLPKFKEMLGNGSKLGISLKYKVQEVPDGLAQAFVLGKKFIGKDSVCLILGDNILYGHNFTDFLLRARNQKEGATVFSYYVNNPERYGVVEFDENRKVLSIEEKPQNPKSHYAVVGLYFYDNDVVSIAGNIKPSVRGEYEITDINQEYLNAGKLNVQIIGRDYTWLDTGTHDSLADATMFVKTIEERTGLKICCIEEIAWRKGFINDKQLLNLAEKEVKSAYGEYLKKIIYTEILETT